MPVSLLQKVRYPQGDSPPSAGSSVAGRVTDWLGLFPFLLFAFAFMVLPAGTLLIGSFQDAGGRFTLLNVAHLFRPSILRSYLLTI
jgi:putative spermidine/putrescine transport system permease protein